MDWCKGKFAGHPLIPLYVMGKILVSNDFPRISPIKNRASGASVSRRLRGMAAERYLSAVMIGEMMTVAHLSLLIKMITTDFSLLLLICNS